MYFFFFVTNKCLNLVASGMCILADNISDHYITFVSYGGLLGFCFWLALTIFKNIEMCFVTN